MNDDDEDELVHCGNCGRDVEPDDFFGFSESLGVEVCYDCAPDDEDGTAQ